MRQHVALQMVHINHGNTQRGGQSLGEAHPYEQGAHETRSARESDGTQLFLRDPCALDCLIHYGYYILLVRARGKLGHHTAVGFMHSLRCSHVRQQHTIADDSGTGVIAGGFDAEDNNRNLIPHPPYKGGSRMFLSG